MINTENSETTGVQVISDVIISTTVLTYRFYTFEGEREIEREM
jgi:hypothetical protein